MLEFQSCPVPCLSSIVAQSLTDIIYVSDPKTYDLLWLSDAAKKMLAGRPLENCKCYNVLHKLDQPCSFCLLDSLTTDSFHTWEHYDSVLDKHFFVRDKMIIWEDKTLHLEIATDMTLHMKQHKSMEQHLGTERLLMDSVRMLLGEETLSNAINNVLERAANQYQADRAYIFERIWGDREHGGISCIYEWCAKGITPQKKKMQNVPFMDARAWLDLFASGMEIIVENLEQIRHVSPALYDQLKDEHIERIIVVPMHLDGVVNGFIGIDNPRTDIEDLTLLHSLAYFIGIELSKNRKATELQEMGLRDSLTGLGNRNAYIKACQRMNITSRDSVGVIFIDLNNLKYINDTYGHARGDDYIRSMSELFTRHFRGRDIFRIGGDEFVFLCEHIPASLFSRKIDSMLRESEDIFPNAIAMGTVWRPFTKDIESMVKEADQIMYTQKQQQKVVRGQCTAEKFMQNQV